MGIERKWKNGNCGSAGSIHLYIYIYMSQGSQNGQQRIE